jgi:hypothetical protein
VHPVVRIVDCVRWHEKAGVAKITAELNRKISSVRCQVGFVTRVVLAVSRLGCSRVATTINAPAATKAIPHHLNECGVALLAVGGGTAPAEFELDVDSVVMHVEDEGTEV